MHLSDSPSDARALPPAPEWDGYGSPIRELVLLNALLAFVLELAIFVIVAWWALVLDVPWWVRVLIAVGAVGALVVLWGTFAAPRARIRLPMIGVVAVKVVAFGCGAMALWGLGNPTAAIVFAVVAAVNVTITTVVRARG